MTNIPDIEVQDLREDFALIFEKNKIDATIVRQSEPEAGNYGYDDETAIPTTSEIQVNIQGISSQSYDRVVQGLITKGSVFRAYVKHSTILRNDDRIRWAGIIFVIKNWNESFKDGQVAFQEFDLIVSDYYS